MKLSNQPNDNDDDEVKHKEFIASVQFWNYYSYLLISFFAGFFSISDLAIQFFFKDDLKVQPGIMGSVTSLTNIPWMIKPLFGLLTDLVPICGYRRKYYIILMGCLISACWFIMAEFCYEVHEAIILLIIINMGVSFCTVLGEATVVELSQLTSCEDDKEDNAKNLVSSYFLIKYFGAMFSSLLGGKLVDMISNRHIFIIAAFLPFLIIISGIIIIECNHENRCLKSNKKVDSDNNDANKIMAIDTPNPDENAKNIMILLNNNVEEIKIKIQNITTKSTENKHNHNDNLYNSQVQNLNVSYQSYVEMCKNPPKPDSDLMCEFFRFITLKFVYIPLIFIILFMATPTYEDPFFYFLTNKLEFKGSFLGWINFFSNLFTLLAIIIYKVWFKGVSFKIMIVFGSLFSFLISFNSYVIVMRYNVTLGISDYVLTLFSSSILSMVGELVMLPMLSLACILCPSNLEGTVYAVFMAAFNFGGILSGLEGSFLTKMFEITSDDFTNLPRLIMIANFCSLLPLFLLIFIKDSYFNPEEERKSQNVQDKIDRGSVHTLENPRENIGEYAVVETKVSDLNNSHIDSLDKIKFHDDEEVTFINKDKKTHN